MPSFGGASRCAESGKKRDFRNASVLLDLAAKLRDHESGWTDPMKPQGRAMFPKTRSMYWRQNGSAREGREMTWAR